jgi:hypothetical protein
VHGGLDQPQQVAAERRRWILDPVVGREGVDRLVVRATRLEQCPGHDERAGYGAREIELVADRRHARPRVEDVRHAVLTQHGEVHGGEEFLVPELHRVHPLARQRGEEFVQPAGEALGCHSASSADGLELEHERAGVAAEVPLVGIVHRLQEHLGIEEIGVRLAGACLVLRLAEGVHGQLIPHLAHAGKPGLQMPRVGGEHLLGRRRVEAGVDSDGAEEGEFGVLAQHLRRGAPSFVLPMVDEAPPARVVPGGGAEADARRQARRERPELFLYLGTILNTRPSALNTYSSPAAS